MNGVNHCGAYLKHLQREHRQLNCALLEIRRQLAELARGSKVRAEVMERLEGFLSELRSHFAEEEAGGCLEEAVARCPRVGAQVKILMEEHPALARSLEELIAGINTQALTESVCQQRFEAFERNF